MTISAHADFHPNQYRFSRQRSDGLPLEKTPPIRAWTSATLGGIGIIAFMIAAFWLAAIIGAMAARADTAVTPPAGAVRFCNTNRTFCLPREAKSLPLSDMTLLKTINRTVNDELLPHALKTQGDMVDENRDWRIELPGGLASCVEYALTKYARLAWDDVPQGAMRIAVVRIRSTGELHAVLLVDIGSTVAVLDNMTPSILTPDLTGYDWLAIQDRSTGWGWVSPDGAVR